METVALTSLKVLTGLHAVLGTHELNTQEMSADGWVQSVRPAPLLSRVVAGHRKVGSLRQPPAFF